MRAAMLNGFALLWPSWKRPRGGSSRRPPRQMHRKPLPPRVIFVSICVGLKKHHQRRGQRHGDIDIARKHFRRQQPQNNVPQYSAAQGGDDRQEKYAENIRVLIRRSHSAGDRKGRHADKLYVLHLGYQILKRNMVTSPSRMT